MNYPEISEAEEPEIGICEHASDIYVGVTGSGQFFYINYPD
jgi:hypothetical protein